MGKQLKRSERSIVTEAAALALVAAGLLVALSLFTYDPLDPSFNVANGRGEAANLVGRAGALVADLLLQTGGLLAAAIPFVLVAFGIRGFVANRIRVSMAMTIGLAVVTLALAGFISLFPKPDLAWLANTSANGGLVGLAVAGALVSVLNRVGAGIVLGLAVLVTAMLTLQVSLVEVFGRARTAGEPAMPFGPIGEWFASLRDRFAAWRVERRLIAAEREAEREEEEAREDRLREERR